MPNNFQPHIPNFQRGERLSAARLNELADAIAKILWHKQQASNAAFGVKAPLEIIGKLDDDLPAATNFGTTAGEAVMTVWVKETSTGNLIETDRKENIKQRFTGAKALSAGAEIKARWIEGEWIADTNGNIVPGIVTARRTCNPGYYTVQLATWNGSYNNETDAAECPTYTVTGEGTTACAIEVIEPSLQVTGLVDESSQPITVLAYHCRSTVVPLKLNKMVLLQNLGDTVVVGTGEEAVTTPVWQIVEGRQVEEIYYEDTYSCCDGTGESGVETLISRVPSILVGMRLPGITCGDCTP